MKLFKIICLVCLISLPRSAKGQALQNINYRYLYTQTESFTFEMKRSKGANEWLVAFRLATKDETISQYYIKWEIRHTMSDTTELQGATATIKLDSSSVANTRTGYVRLSREYDDNIFVAKIIHKERRQAWYFFESLPKDYPVDAFLLDDKGNVIFSKYVLPESKGLIKDADTTRRPHFLTYYRTDFPAAVPAFSEGMASVSSLLEVDTTTTIGPSDTIMFVGQGGYLAQRDTLSPTGLPIFVYDDYPKFTHFRNLSAPLVYICTKNEYDRLRQAGDDKKSFDRVILSITGNAERARIFMRSYFRRVELANTLFASYKEGWKTDRGMILIVYGIPNEVYKFRDREVWNYSGTTFTGTFEFIRTGTLFDADNYVLIRNQKYKEKWYEIVDLWRNSRF